MLTKKHLPCALPCARFANLVKCQHSQINPTIYNSWTWEDHIAGIVNFESKYLHEKRVFTIKSFQIIVLQVVLFDLSHPELFFVIRKCFNEVLEVCLYQIFTQPPVKTNRFLFYLIEDDT